MCIYWTYKVVSHQKCEILNLRQGCRKTENSGGVVGGGKRLNFSENCGKASKKPDFY